MLTPEDKKWLEAYLDQRFTVERELMREFIIKGRHEDRTWVKGELGKIREFIIEGRKQDRSWVKEELDEYSRTVALGFNDVYSKIHSLESRCSWN